MTMTAATTSAHDAVLETLNVAARSHAHDLQIRLAGDQAIMAVTVDGQLHEIGSLAADDCETLLSAAYALCDGDGQFQYGTYQSAKMTGEKAPLPPDISVIHLQFSPRKDGARHLVARFTRSGDTCCGTCGGSA